MCKVINLIVIDHDLNENRLRIFVVFLFFATKYMTIKFLEKWTSPLDIICILETFSIILENTIEI